jgi:hypothetical protein
VEVVAETNAVAEKEAVTAMGVRRRRSRGGSSGDPERGILNIEDHVWFEDRWMVASLCDE